MMLELLQNEAVQNFLILVFTPIITAVVAYVSNVIRILINELILRIKLSTNERQFKILEDGVRFAVTAAEQAGLANLIQNEGQSKKNYALQAVKVYLKSRGLNVLADNVELISDAIEKHIGVRNEV